MMNRKYFIKVLTSDGKLLSELSTTKKNCMIGRSLLGDIRFQLPSIKDVHLEINMAGMYITAYGDDVLINNAPITTNLQTNFNYGDRIELRKKVITVEEFEDIEVGNITQDLDAHSPYELSDVNTVTYATNKDNLVERKDIGNNEKETSPPTGTDVNASEPLCNDINVNLKVVCNPGEIPVLDLKIEKDGVELHSDNIRINFNPIETVCQPTQPLEEESKQVFLNNSDIKIIAEEKKEILNEEISKNVEYPAIDTEAKKGKTKRPMDLKEAVIEKQMMNEIINIADDEIKEEEMLIQQAGVIENDASEAVKSEIRKINLKEIPSSSQHDESNALNDNVIAKYEVKSEQATYKTVSEDVEREDNEQPKEILGEENTVSAHEEVKCDDLQVIETKCDDESLQAADKTNEETKEVQQNTEGGAKEVKQGILDEDRKVQENLKEESNKVEQEIDKESKDGQKEMQEEVQQETNGEPEIDKESKDVLSEMQEETNDEQEIDKESKDVLREMREEVQQETNGEPEIDKEAKEVQQETNEEPEIDKEAKEVQQETNEEPEIDKEVKKEMKEEVQQESRGEFKDEVKQDIKEEHKEENQDMEDEAKEEKIEKEKESKAVKKEKKKSEAKEEKTTVVPKRSYRLSSSKSPVKSKSNRGTDGMKSPSKKAVLKTKDSADTRKKRESAKGAIVTKDEQQPKKRSKTTPKKNTKNK